MFYKQNPSGCWKIFSEKEHFYSKNNLLNTLRAFWEFFNGGPLNVNHKLPRLLFEIVLNKVTYCHLKENLRNRSIHLGDVSDTNCCARTT